MASTINDTKFRQDMPPQEGYAKIYTQRTYPRIGSKIGKRVGLGFGGLFLVGYFLHLAGRASHMRWLVENNDVRMVTTAFHNAERDRIWLNFLRDLRNQERDLMKDVPGWRTGTFYGEPIFFTLPPNAWWDPSGPETMAHTSHYNQRFNYTWRLDVDMRGGPKWYDKYLPYWLENL